MRLKVFSAGSGKGGYADIHSTHEVVELAVVESCMEHNDFLELRRDANVACTSEMEVERRIGEAVVGSEFGFAIERQITP